MTIKIKDYSKENQKLSFLTDMPISLANAIRRSVLEIPVLAIDEVEIVKNDSALYDEIIAHRLGLVPLKTTPTIKETKFKLKAKGPKTVYSTDISPSVGVDYKLPVAILDDEQEIEIIANAKLGNGTEHIKYSPGLIFYKHNLDDDVLDFVEIDEEGKVNFNEEELQAKKLSEEQINKIKKAKEAKELVFSIESWKQIEVKEIFSKSIEALNKNLDQLSKAVK
jgi:DNA-directed RNA polymerase subunit D